MNGLDSGLQVEVLFQISEARIWGGTCPRDTALMLKKPCPSRDGCVQGTKSLGVVIPTEDGSAPRGVHRNPELTGLMLDEVQWPAEVTPSIHFVTPSKEASEGDEKTDGSTTTLQPTWTQESIELVRKAADAGLDDIDERLTFSFYSDAGDFEYRQTGDQAADNSFSAPMPKDATRPVRIWVVARDDRGGVDWLSRQLVLDPSAVSGVHPLCATFTWLPGCDERAP